MSQVYAYQYIGCFEKKNKYEDELTIKTKEVKNNKRIPTNKFRSSATILSLINFHS